MAKPFWRDTKAERAGAPIQTREGPLFRCDEKWVVGHNCCKKELSILVGQEDGEVEYGSLEDLSHLDSPISPSSEPPQSEILLNFVMGLSSPKMLKMAGTINGQFVIVMVDLGPPTTLFLLKRCKGYTYPYPTLKPLGFRWAKEWSCLARSV